MNVKTLFIEPGSPWENGYIESFNGKLRDELLVREIFDTVLEARVLLTDWKKEYNAVRPHSALGYRPTAPDAVLPLGARHRQGDRPIYSRINLSLFGRLTLDFCWAQEENVKRGGSESTLWEGC